MHDVNAWPTLIDLAQHATDQAAKQLQSLAKAKTDANAQLDMLLSYRQDYAERMQQAAGKGLSASNYHNFHRFIATLDEAIVQQNANIRKLDAEFEQCRLQWLDEKRKLNAYETLLQRQQARQQVIQNRQEQRLNDESSANLYRRANPPH